MVHPCNVCDKAFKSLPTPNQHKIWQHSGHVLSARLTTASTDKKLVCGKPRHRKSFSNFMLGKDRHQGDHPQSEPEPESESKLMLILLLDVIPKIIIRLTNTMLLPALTAAS